MPYVENISFSDSHFEMFTAWKICMWASHIRMTTIDKMKFNIYEYSIKINRMNHRELIVSFIEVAAPDAGQKMIQIATACRPG